MENFHCHMEGQLPTECTDFAGIQKNIYNHCESDTLCESQSNKDIWL